MRLPCLCIPAVGISLGLSCRVGVVRAFGNAGSGLHGSFFLSRPCLPRRFGTTLGVGLLGIRGATFFFSRSLKGRTVMGTSGLAAAMLSYESDSYNGVIIDETSFPPDTEAFSRALQASVEAWKAEKRRGVWLKIPVERAELITVALGEDFELHHAEKAYVMLNR
ncbi:unnamed protein product [Discosporangium mesarthrocarpum]